MSNPLQAVVSTLLTLSLMVHLALSLTFRAMASAVADPATGRTCSWPFFSRGARATFVTHDQCWVLAITGGLMLGCLLALLVIRAPRRALWD